MRGMGSAKARRATWVSMALLVIGALVLVVAPLGPFSFLVVVISGLGASVAAGRSRALRTWNGLPGFFRPDGSSVIVALLTGAVLGAVVGSSVHGSPAGRVGAGVAAGVFVALAIYCFFIRLGVVSDVLNRRSESRGGNPIDDAVPRPD